jgi:pyruvate dehydrogenase E1 component alpha subunit
MTVRKRPGRDGQGRRLHDPRLPSTAGPGERGGNITRTAAKTGFPIIAGRTNIALNDKNDTPDGEENTMASGLQLSRHELIAAYKRMRLIREFEEAVHQEFSAGNIPGFVHLYAGEEASGVGVCMHLDDRDAIASTHRGHGHCIAKGCDAEAMMLEIFGRKDGLCGGKGGSMHIADLSKGMLGANGIVGAGAPLACGAALTAKTLGTGGVSICFYGDGASNQGAVLESYNLAKIWNLPMVFVAEDNGYAEATASSWSVGGSQSARANGFDIPSREVDGTDFFAVYEAAGEAIERARNGGGPSLLHVRLNRFYGHFEGDAMTYRHPEEVPRIRANLDPLDLFRQRVIEASLIPAADLDAIDRETVAEAARCVKVAKAAPLPTAADLMTDVYVSY